MSKKFYAVHRETGERWNSKKHKSTGSVKSYLVMYDSGYLAEVAYDGWYTYVHKLDPKVWKTVNRMVGEDG